MKQDKKQFLTKNFAFELKAASEDDQYFYFEGYGAVFNNVDLGDDIILPGAFKNSLAKRTPKLCWQHDIQRPMGVFTEAYEDDKGLYLKGKMPKEHSLARDAILLMKCSGGADGKAALDSMSIGYNIWNPGGYEYREDGIRVLKTLNLWEVSMVTIPMNPKATVTGMKKFKFEDVKDVKSKKEFEELLLETGAFSRKASTALAKYFQADQSESEKKEAEQELAQRKSDELAAQILAELKQTTNTLKGK